jgi:hypothetical protein
VRGVKRVLIVSPHFPPLNAPDMHRVRMSAPYFPECGWQPIVLTVRPEDQDLPMDPGLTQTLPADLRVVSVTALPARWTRRVGVGNAAIRALGSLFRAGSRILQSESIDLVYFSTTQFVSMTLGRVWKRRFGVPFVIDLQDPWFSTYYDDKPASERPPKHTFARAMHQRLERWTLRDVDGVISVASAYTDTLRERYPWITDAMCATIPFGASERDFDFASRDLPESAGTAAGARSFNGVYIGRGGADMATALRIVFRALATGATISPRFDDVRLSFIGTTYARGSDAQKTVERVAAQEGVRRQVAETTARLPYLETLRQLRVADFLVIIGSDDPQYSASKVYSYVLARRPLLAIVHEASPLAEIIRNTRAGEVITFSERGDVDGPAARLASAWARMLEKMPFVPETDWTAFAPYTARALTREQCRMFDAVVQPRMAEFAVPCRE